MKLVFSVLVLPLFSSMALAAGDPPRELSREQANEYFASYKPVLAVHGCPGDQVPIFGVVNGGAAPVGGSQTVELKLSGGATFKIITSWSKIMGDKGYAHVSTTYQCDL
jgi:hypothetical protein